MSVTCNKYVGRCALYASLVLGVAACSSTPQTNATANSVAAATTLKQAPAAVTQTTAVPSNSVAPPILPAEAQQQFDAAMQLVNSGQRDAAVAKLEQLANAYPTVSAPLINIGLLYLKANQFEMAERAFKRALERDPQSAPAHNYLGVCYRNLGKFKDAEAAYRSALAGDTDYAAAHLNLGVLYDLYLQQPEQALNEYERYQQLLATPDTKVTGWIKELKTRIGSKAKGAAAASGVGDKS